MVGMFRLSGNGILLISIRGSINLVSLKKGVGNTSALTPKDSKAANIIA